jgi:plastocyanin
VTMPRAVCLAATAAVLLMLPTAAQAKSKTKTVTMGLPAAAQGEFQNKYGADVNDFFPHKVTIRAGDKVRFRPTGFHSMDLPGKGDDPTLPLFSPTGTKATNTDANGAPFWFTGKLDNVGFNPALLNGLFGKHVTYKKKRVESGLPLAPNPKPFTVRFKKKGKFKYYCDVHPGMTGTVVVKGKKAKVPTAKQDRKRLKKQLRRDRKRAKGLATSAPPAGSTVYVGGSTAGGVEYFGMLPGKKIVKVGTTVTFMMSPKSFEAHTATFGPGPAEDPASYLGGIAKTFEGAPVLDARGVYPSEAPGTTANLTSALHGNGFWNSGVMDNSAASPPASSAAVKFTQTGTFDYYCLIHPFMHGQVEVTP